MKRNLVPIGEIGPVIRELIEERWPHGSGYEVLAEKIGYDASAIYGIAMVERATADFDLVDKILCGLGRFDHWYGRFSHLYPTKFMETCALPVCGKKFPEKVGGGNRQQYCSKLCKDLAADVRGGRATGERYRQRNRCNRGHKLTSDNVKISKLGDGSSIRQCRTCQRKLQREWARKRLREDEGFAERKRAAQRRWREKQKAAA